MNSNYSSVNEEDLAEDQLTQPAHFHPDPNSNTHHPTSSGGHYYAARTLSIDRDESGPAATAITFGDDTNKAPPSYAMGSPTSPPRVGGKQALSRFRAIANQAGTVDATVMDMNQTQYTKQQGMANSEFLAWLQQPRPEWSTVRWININGMSWDVIKAIAIKYDLHHLAVEDLLHIPQRTKVDIYPKHTYIACTLLTLMEVTEDGELKLVDPLKSPVGIDPEMLCQRMPLESVDHFRYQYPVGERGPNVLKAHMEQVTMFLLPDGTFITLFQVSGASVVNPIVERLTHDYSIVRKHGDASFLLQSVMDGIVDHAIPITDAFRQEINDLETHVLALPRMKFTKELHQLTAQLSMLKRTLAPTQALVHALRGRDARSPLTDISRTYMGDVMDHCNTMVEDIDSMLALCDKLIDMIFNIIAYDTNESMRRLALVSIIFLPITFVAGVYGTNFENFPELRHSIGYFWVICGVVTAIVLAMFILEWLKNKYRTAEVEKRLKRRHTIDISQKNR
ncbi:hypothetical protein KI688_012706 [Linnemannia hyalina]|uniref:Uncharacterized protein n=1 Tax=Linnemannia hyalina TaxID=64524 RepID=A0A9P7XVR6_9FUNG|nr:hypothetical protein KI688_012706 [Linnemannia hyalina]